MWQDFNANTSSTRRPMYGHLRWTAAQSAPCPTREAWGTSWWSAQPSPLPPPSQPEPVPSGRHPRMHPTGAKHQARGGRTSCLLLDLRTCLFREGMRLEAEGNHAAAIDKYKAAVAAAVEDHTSKDVKYENQLDLYKPSQLGGFDIGDAWYKIAVCTRAIDGGSSRVEIGALQRAIEFGAATRLKHATTLANAWLEVRDEHGKAITLSGSARARSRLCDRAPQPRAAARDAAGRWHLACNHETKAVELGIERAPKSRRVRADVHEPNRPMDGRDGCVQRRPPPRAREPTKKALCPRTGGGLPASGIGVGERATVLAGRRERGPSAVPSRSALMRGEKRPAFVAIRFQHGIGARLAEP